MPAHRTPPWTCRELAVLREFYPAGGLDAVADLLADRSWQAIYVMAHKLGIKTTNVSEARVTKLQGEPLELAIRLREEEGWSFARIGARLGLCEASVNNAVMIALCARKGFTPIERDARGHITAAGLERLRLALRKGLKGIDIQLRLGISASRVTFERRRYSADLKARGKAPLPPPGAGAAYSGVKLSAAKKREAERLLREGYGALKVSQRTGVSKTSIGRIRTRLIRRLTRRGDTLAGCDIKGRRRGACAESWRYVPDDAVAELRRRILAGEPTRRAATDLGVGGSAADRVRHALVAELAARGETLPAARRPATRAEAITLVRQAAWLPKKKWSRYRLLTYQHGFAEAKRLCIEEIAAERTAEMVQRITARRAESFEDKLARVARGDARLVAHIPLRRADPAMTLGGFGSAML